MLEVFLVVVAGSKGSIGTLVLSTTHTIETSDLEKE